MPPSSTGGSEASGTWPLAPYLLEGVDAGDRNGRPLITPASAYAEALVAFARADRVDDAHAALAGMGITVAPLTEAIAERAASLRARHERLRLPDALVLATAEAHGGTLLSYDEQIGQIADGRR